MFFARMAWSGWRGELLVKLEATDWVHARFEVWDVAEKFGYNYTGVIAFIYGNGLETREYNWKPRQSEEY